MGGVNSCTCSKEIDLLTNLNLVKEVSNHKNRNNKINENIPLEVSKKMLNSCPTYNKEDTFDQKDCNESNLQNNNVISNINSDKIIQHKKEYSTDLNIELEEDNINGISSGYAKSNKQINYKDSSFTMNKPPLEVINEMNAEENDKNKTISTNNNKSIIVNTINQVNQEVNQVDAKPNNLLNKSDNSEMNQPKRLLNVNITSIVPENKLLNCSYGNYYLSFR